MEEKVKFIKNIFNILFPYDLDFRVKFFDYIESQKEEESLEIIGSLLQILQNQKSHEQNMIIDSVLKEVRKKGISIDIVKN